MDWYFDKKIYFGLLIIVVLFVVLFFLYTKWQINKKNLFSEKEFQDKYFVENKYQKLFFVLIFSAVILLIFSIIDVVSGNESIKTKGNSKNIIFALDFSNSMNVEDLNPNRLEHAKKLILNTLPNLKNDKVSLIVFAGDAVSIMPLTKDFTSVETYIEGLTTDLMRHQGTDFLPMIKVAIENFQNSPKDSRNLVILSDGEDNESNVNSLISEANSENINIVSIGIGTEDGGTIPIYDLGQMMDYKRDAEGKVVVSMLMKSNLIKIANACNGEYIDGNEIKTATNQLKSYLNNMKTSSSENLFIKNNIHYYQYLLAFSLALFFIIYLTNPKNDFNI